MLASQYECELMAYLQRLSRKKSDEKRNVNHAYRAEFFSPLLTHFIYMKTSGIYVKKGVPLRWECLGCLQEPPSHTVVKVEAIKGDNYWNDSCASSPRRLMCLTDVFLPVNSSHLNLASYQSPRFARSCMSRRTRHTGKLHLEKKGFEETQ